MFSTNGLTRQIQFTTILLEKPAVYSRKSWIVDPDIQVGVVLSKELKMVFLYIVCSTNRRDTFSHYMTLVLIGERRGGAAHN